MDNLILDFYSGESVMDAYNDDMLFLFYYRNSVVEDNLGRLITVLREGIHLTQSEVENGKEYFKQIGKYTILSSRGYTYNLTTGKYNYGIDNSFGYMAVSVGSGNNRETTTMNSLVYRTFVGPIKEGHVVHHINHNKEDNRLSNLAMITRADNLRERFMNNPNLGKQMFNNKNNNYIYCESNNTLYRNKATLAKDLGLLISACNKVLDDIWQQYKGYKFQYLTASQMEQLKAYEKEHDFLFFNKDTKMVKLPQITL